MARGRGRVTIATVLLLQLALCLEIKPSFRPASGIRWGVSHKSPSVAQTQRQQRPTASTRAGGAKRPAKLVVANEQPKRSPSPCQIPPGTPYWFDPRIHSMGNVGLTGFLHALFAPLATWMIDLLSCETTPPNPGNARGPLPQPDPLTTT